MKKEWYMYVLECSDGSLYAGSTTDVSRRVNEHNNSSKGAKYTRSRRPVRLIAYETHMGRSPCLKAEAAFKKLKRTEKIEYAGKIRVPSKGDTVLARSPAGDCIPAVHVRLLERVEVEPRSGKRVGIRMTMDWPGYKGWEAELVNPDEAEMLRKKWSIPFKFPDLVETFVYDDCIIKVTKWAPKLEKSRRRIVR